MNRDKDHLKAQQSIFIGVMSGTSADAVDLAAVQFTVNDSKEQARLIAAAEYPIEQNLQNEILSFCRPSHSHASLQNSPAPSNSIVEFGELDQKLGKMFASAVNQFINDFSLSKKDISAIGLHGQTLWHQPDSEHPFSLQAGDPNQLVAHTGLTTVADFRRMDMALGGQGAPLVPAFHQALFQTDAENRIILNLGGIANLTLLPADNKSPVIGFDSGPANTLLDAHYRRHFGPQKNRFDNNGKFAGSGTVNQHLLHCLLADPFFAKAPPKSTGTEYFTLSRLDKILNNLDYPLAPEDIQATLLQLTVESISQSIENLSLADFNLILCGGGQHNGVLVEALNQRLGLRCSFSSELGVDGDVLEAMLMAWLAYRRINGLSANLPAVTGASRSAILGAVYSGIIS